MFIVNKIDFLQAYAGKYNYLRTHTVFAIISLSIFYFKEPHLKSNIKIVKYQLYTLFIY